jgi:preprotein translocase subunit SecG
MAALVPIVTVIHILITIALIGVILIQRSEGGGLGIGGGGGGGMGGFMTGRGTANLLTKATAILAGVFMLTSVALTLLASGGRSTSIMDVAPAAPTSTAPAPVAPPANTAPSAPVK